jgi:hypothetical protein
MVVKAKSSFYDSAPDYVMFSFITQDGDTITHSRKCSKKTYDSEYHDLKIIYNGDNPEEFDTLTEYTYFNSGGYRFFFFILYPLFLTFFLIVLFQNLSALIEFIRSKRTLGCL